MKRIYIERRHRRSNNFIEAIQLYFQSLTQKDESRAIVLADVDGLLIGGFCRDGQFDLHELASMCPVLLKVGRNNFGNVSYLPSEINFSILLFSYRQEPLYLLAIGGSGKNETLLCAMEGVCRILGD